MRCLFVYVRIESGKLYNSTQISLKVGIVLIILKAFVYELEYIVWFMVKLLKKALLDVIYQLAVSVFENVQFNHDEKL
jgi:hypothetical protein